MSKKYIVFNEANILAARYDSEIHGDNIPDGAIEVDDATFQATIQENDGVWTLTESGIVKEPFPTEDPEAVKERIWTAIKAKRDLVKQGGVLVAGEWFHSDDASRIQQLGLKDRSRDALAAGGEPNDGLVIDGDEVAWKTMEGGFVIMTPELAFEIVNAIGILDKRAFKAAEIHRATMRQHPDPASYDFSGGWPETFPA
jgi:hypothetical protein